MVYHDICKETKSIRKILVGYLFNHRVQPRNSILQCQSRMLLLLIPQTLPEAIDITSPFIIIFFAVAF